MAYKQPRRETADSYLPAQLRLLRRLFPTSTITEASVSDDMTRNTDCLLDGKRVMLRMDYTPHHDGVIFRHTPSSYEWGKVLAGHGDWMLMCWASSPESFDYWCLINLRVLVAQRKHIPLGLHHWSEGRDYGRDKLHFYKCEKRGCRLYLGGCPLGLLSDPAMGD